MKTIYFPAAFFIGSGILHEFFERTKHFGDSFAFIGTKSALKAIEELAAAAKEAGIRASFVLSDGHPTYKEVDRVDALEEVRQAEVIVGTGGGGVLDIARAAAMKQGKPVIMLPTAVASDAACTRVTVYYDEDGGGVVGDAMYDHAPDLVYVDAAIIAKAPPRLLASGIGDALATWYEALTCYHHPEVNDITAMGMVLARACKDIVLEDAYGAYLSVLDGVSSPQLERLLEATCFLSGVGGMNTGCAAAHGIGDYLADTPLYHRFSHGERVNVGLIVQMVLERYDEEEIREIIRLGRRVQLPVSLKDLGCTDVANEAVRLAKGLQGDHFMEHLCCDYSVPVLSGAFCIAQRIADEEEER